MKHISPVPTGGNRERRVVRVRRSSGTGVERLLGLLPDPRPVQMTEDHVHSLLNARRGREVLFGRELFSDPAWDLILELYAAKLGNGRMSAPQLARSIGVSETIAYRWIAALVEAGIVFWNEKLSDSTETTLELSNEAGEKMDHLAKQWSSAFISI